MVLQCFTCQLVHFQLQLAHKEVSGYRVELMTLRDVWRCVTMEPGELSVMTSGTSMTLLLSADNLAMD